MMALTTNPIEVQVVTLDNSVHRRDDSKTRVVGDVIWVTFIIVNPLALILAQINHQPTYHTVPVGYWRNNQVVNFPRN